MIKRFKLPILRELCSQFPVVSIVGPRQVGKTTLAKQLMRELEKESVYIDLELDSDYSLLEEPEIFLRKCEEKCVVIDEIQRKPELFTLIRALVDIHRVPARFILLGSASPVLIQRGTDTLAGRIAFEELSSFNLTEINHKNNLQKHWLRGGLPEIFLAPDDKTAFRYLNRYTASFIERELIQLGLNTNPVLLKKFWQMLAHFHGGIWNASAFAGSLGVSANTVNRYLEFLEHAFIIHVLRPYFLSVRKRLVKSPKVYIRDSGILHCLTGIDSSDDLNRNILIGRSWEGYVIEQLKTLLPENAGLWFYRTQDGAECDLVITRGNTPVASVEIKYSVSLKLSIGFFNCIRDMKTKNNFLICLTDKEIPMKENTIACNLMGFIENHMPRLIQKN